MVRKTYGQAAINVTKGHSSQHFMVASMTLFIKDLAKEVERVGGLRKKGIDKHNVDATNPRVPQPVVMPSLKLVHLSTMSESYCPIPTSTRKVPMDGHRMMAS